MYIEHIASVLRTKFDYFPNAYRQSLPPIPSKFLMNFIPSYTTWIMKYDFAVRKAFTQIQATLNCDRPPAYPVTCII